MIKKWNVKIYPISPIHIGDGEILDPTEYIAKDGFVYYLNQTVYISELLQSGCVELKNALDKMDLSNIIQILEKNFLEKNRLHWISRTSVSQSFCNTWKQDLSNSRNSQQLHRFIQNKLNGQPYIPGSSIKGSIRTAVLSGLAEDESKFKEISRLANSTRANSQSAEAILLNATNRNGRMAVSEDPFKYLKVSDVFIEPQDLFIDKIMRVNMAKEELPIFYEMIKEESAEFNFSIHVDQRFETTCDYLFYEINKFYKRLASSDLQWIEGNVANSLDYRNNLATKVNSIKSAENRCLIRLGFGSGQRSISLEPFWKKNLKTKAFWKNKLLGWAELHFEEL